MVLPLITLLVYLVTTRPNFCGVKSLGLRMCSVHNHFGDYTICSSRAFMEHNILNYAFGHTGVISSFFSLNNAALNIFRNKPPALNFFRNKQSSIELQI